MQSRSLSQASYGIAIHVVFLFVFLIKKRESGNEKKCVHLSAIMSGELSFCAQTALNSVINTDFLRINQAPLTLIWYVS